MESEVIYTFWPKCDGNCYLLGVGNVSADVLIELAGAALGNGAVTWTNESISLHVPAALASGFPFWNTDAQQLWFNLDLTRQLVA